MNSFEIVCRCGSVCRGERGLQHLELPCPGCGRRVFVLPQAPGTVSVAGSGSRPWPPWLGPVLAGVLSLLVCTALYLLVLAGLLSDAGAGGNSVVQAQVMQHQSKARTALDQADFAFALQELTAAEGLLKQHPNVLPGAASRQLRQLTKQVNVVATWPGEPLDRIVDRGRPLTDGEWEAVMQRYRGRGVILDLVIRRTAAGSYHARFRREAVNERVQLNLDDLALLRYLPLSDSRRVVLGARLADLRRDDQGHARLSVEPSSGVLLTDLAVLKGCRVGDAELVELAAQQEAWARDLPDVD